ncbi:hypothetical protein A2851_00575 [Candidatus Kaiserbacteria bacterium RIFCSPHIGHO2_01_FULL_53_29]|uniref:DUF4405 domain-containing protein n=1 Tax=Candidatus Kaiserbacteria bacterium RIFCSPHIGHO2_01_FULL_53_29 TaxID=1798480 RepID=A0A1F6CU45_9BACT|nr:MAG: hypothetical protein A2851_00575 [Candidatus Kaiserbacteria bacterium RIFCSPHIGHO2_01_FULL_53_29]
MNMKLSKAMHVGSVIVGFIGVVWFLIAVFGSPESAFGITKMDALACAAILILIAIWTQIGTIHHMMLERRGEII